MSRDQKEICLYCKWWEPDSFHKRIGKVGLDTKGTCYFHPPTAFQVGSSDLGFSVSTALPEAKASSHCSKFTGHPDNHGDTPDAD